MFGLEGNDEFIFKGHVKSSILVRVIAGSDKDIITDNSNVSGLRKHTVIYDNKASGNVFDFSKETKNMTSDNPEVNAYKRKSFQYDHLLPLVVLSGNKDDGFMFGAGFKSTKEGFRKTPYKSQQKVKIQYALATNAASAFYDGDFIHKVKSWDIHVNAHLKAPTYVSNFFGLGNETVNVDDSEGLDYNRLRLAQVLIEPSLKKRFANDIHVFTIGPRYELTQMERTEGRFVEDAANLSNVAFEQQVYFGLQSTYSIHRVDNDVFPTRGLKLKVGAAWNNDAYDLSNDYWNFKGDLTSYFSMKRPFKATLAARVGVDWNEGNYQVYQAATLGRTNNLRGFRGQRFAGDQAAWANADLRIPLFKLKSKFIPGTLEYWGSMTPDVFG